MIEFPPLPSEFPKASPDAGEGAPANMPEDEGEALQSSRSRRRRTGRITRYLLRPFFWLLSLTLTGVAIGGIAVLVVFYIYSKDLPDSSSLANYQPAGMTRLYAADGELIAEYAKERRVFLPYNDIPRPVIEAFIAAEDQNFYSHRGIDPAGIVRALVSNLRRYGGQERSLVGGSTITQQVVKNFLLTREKSIERKIKEAILSLRITQTYSKNRILELYLNEIYLGMGAYGVAAAAQEYFGKDLAALSTEEVALLAAMPKAPAYYDPRRRPEEARERRNYVLGRMHEDGYINDAEYERATAAPLTLHPRRATTHRIAPHFAEEIRRTLLEKLGQEKLYKGSLYVKTTLDSEAQVMLAKAYRAALETYDQRHGYRGALARLPSLDGWEKAVRQLEATASLHDGKRLGVVLELTSGSATFGVLSAAQPPAPVPSEDEQKPEQVSDDGESEVKEVSVPTLPSERVSVPLKAMQWARPVQPSGAMGAVPSRPADILAVGDVVLLAPDGKEPQGWALSQIPKVSGAMVAMRPRTGEVIAMAGGYDFRSSEFNRATQARRQPGSSFKPFVYLAALERGFTPSSIVVDGPIEISQGPGLPAWRPQNYGGDFLGPTTLRTGLEKSRNVMTVRLAQMIGIKAIADVGKRFGIYDELPYNYSSVLGSHETTLLQLVTAYSMLANGGLKVEPTLIARIDDATGKTVYRAAEVACQPCTLQGDGLRVPEDRPPLPEETPERVADPRVAYQMVSLLEGVTKRGTAASAASLGFPTAGKTGTTNDSRDAWFIGFTQDLVVGTYVGFDTPRDMGAKETGGRVALPAFMGFMKAFYEKAPPPAFIIPPGILQIVVDKSSGTPPLPWNPPGQTITETFVTGGAIFIPGSGHEEEAQAEVVQTPEAVSDGQSATPAPEDSSVPYRAQREMEEQYYQQYQNAPDPYAPQAQPQPYPQQQPYAPYAPESYQPVPPVTQPSAPPALPWQRTLPSRHHDQRRYQQQLPPAQRGGGSQGSIGGVY